MSVYTLEKVLWDLNVNRDSKRRFKDDPAKLLSRYHLTPRESEMIQGFDVRGLCEAGVSTMLTMGFWMELEGSRDMGGYLKRMNSSALTAN